MANLLLQKKGRFHDVVWADLEEILSPREVRRYVQLAGVLEPISEKEGCTTRTKDLNQFQKLEYFLTGAINIGDAFEDLAYRILHKGFPITTYDLAFKAQTDSKKNRRGGRVNQGVIEFLFPLIISQLVNKEKTPEEIITRVPLILEQTTSQDTVWLQKMQNFAFEMSGYYERNFPINKERTILEYYKKRLNNSIKPSDIFHNEEIVNTYPTLRYMLKTFNEQDSEYPLSESMKTTYDKAKEKYPEIPKGILADLNACLIYLISSCQRTSKIVN